MYGGSPSAISITMMPSDQMSTLAVYSCPRISSGAIQYGVLPSENTTTTGEKNINFWKKKKKKFNQFDKSLHSFVPDDGLALRFALGQLCSITEISQLDFTGRGKQQVVTLDISVNAMIGMQIAKT